MAAACSSVAAALSANDSIEFKAVLLVDDDKQLAVALQWILADQNFMVDVANDGAEALLKVKERRWISDCAPTRGLLV